MASGRIPQLFVASKETISFRSLYTEMKMEMVMPCYFFETTKNGQTFRRAGRKTNDAVSLSQANLKRLRAARMARKRATNEADK